MKFMDGVSKDLGKRVKVPKGLREPKHKTWTSTQLAAPQMRKAVKSAGINAQNSDTTVCSSTVARVWIGVCQSSVDSWRNLQRPHTISS